MRQLQVVSSFNYPALVARLTYMFQPYISWSYLKFSIYKVVLLSLKHMVHTLKNLGIGHCNMEGGLATNLAKTAEIKDVIFREKLDLFGLNETNVSETVDNKSLNIPLNYEIERCDRPNQSSRGGCAVIISNRIKYRVYPINI